MEYITKQQAREIAKNAYSQSHTHGEFYDTLDYNLNCSPSFDGVGAVLCSECKHFKESYVTIKFGDVDVAGGNVRFCTRDGELDQIPDWCDWCSAGERKMEGE